ncbi:MAG: hypothetical protein R2862_13400 [Thermoanaerobaculia bacterium]
MIQSTSRRRTIPTLAIPALAMAALLAGVAPGVAEEVTFYFAPPVGSEYVLKQVTTSEVRVGGNREVHSLVSRSDLRIRREAGTYYLARRIDQMAVAPAGEKYTTPPQLEALLGSEIVHILGEDGALRRVDGYARIAARALPLMKGEAKKRLELYVAEGRQEDRDKADWYELEMLLGQRLELERDYWFEAAWPDEAGWARHQTLVRAGPWTDTPDGRLLTVNLAYVDNATATIPGAVQLSPRVKTRFNPSAPGKLGDRLKLDGAATWLMDPATGIVWKIQSRRKMSQPVRVTEEVGLTIVSEEQIHATLERAAGKR